LPQPITTVQGTLQVTKPRHTRVHRNALERNATLSNPQLLSLIEIWLIQRRWAYGDILGATTNEGRQVFPGSGLPFPLLARIESAGGGHER